jgi:hypothetical protein
VLVERVGRSPFFSTGRQLGAGLDKRLAGYFPRWYKGGKTGVRSIANEIKENNRYWEDFLFTLCAGDASEMMILKRYDIFDFFEFVENKMKSHAGNRSRIKS